VITLPADATIAEAPALWAELARAEPGEVDAGALQSVDTSTIALLLEARRRAQAGGITFAVRNAPPKLVELARLYGVDGLLALDAGAAIRS
jgi:phospholipid transport system transporter-binding protein